MAVVVPRSLKDRYRRLRGELIDLKEPAKRHFRLESDRRRMRDEAAWRSARIAEIERVLPGLATAIRLYDADWDEEGAGAVRPLVRRSPLPHGGLTQAAFDVLRVAREKMTTREIVAVICDRYDIDRSTVAARERLRDNIGRSLARLPDQIAHDGGRPRRWWLIGGLADD